MSEREGNVLEKLERVVNMSEKDFGLLCTTLRKRNEGEVIEKFISVAIIKRKKMAEFLDGL